MACDLYAVRTALDVAGKFSFKVDTMVFAVCLWGIAMMILALWFLKRLGLTHISWKPLTRFGTVTGIILILMISFQGKVLEKYTEVKPFYYSHGTNCFALNFILQLVNYKIEPPKGYEISAIDTTELSMEVERGEGGDRILL